MLAVQTDRVMGVCDGWLVMTWMMRPGWDEGSSKGAHRRYQNVWQSERGHEMVVSVLGGRFFSTSSFSLGSVMGARWLGGWLGVVVGFVK
jgi:hypothetical protein